MTKKNDVLDLSNVPQLSLMDTLRLCLSVSASETKSMKQLGVVPTEKEKQLARERQRSRKRPRRWYKK